MVSESKINVFPKKGSTLNCGSKELEKDKPKSFNPLKALNTINSDAEAVITNVSVMKLIILITFCLLLETKYLDAMYNEKFRLI
tara:strand:+ start:103 stop:354 length:252 start_codon:yes stop_codon:yes gene_type:complete